MALVTAGAGLLPVWHAVPPSPALAGRGPGLRLSALASVWTDRRVRASVFGYFGHMVELYTMWVLVPTILATRLAGAALSWAAFAVLAAGALGCVGGGLGVRRFGSARVAGIQLAASGLCCLAAPWALAAPALWFALWLLVWGVTVAGDSPQFSTLTARNAPREAVGSVLTLTNSIGFAISIVSIEVFVRLAQAYPLQAVSATLDGDRPAARPGRPGAAVREIFHASPHIRVLVVTLFEDGDSVFAALLR